MAVKQTYRRKVRIGQSTRKKKKHLSKEKNAYAKKVRTAKLKKRARIHEGMFLLIVTFCVIGLLQIKSHRVAGHSMQPTLENNDRIIVKKGCLPERYDLITFDPEIPEESSYVKRVIGLPGDQLWSDQTGVYIRSNKAKTWKLESNQELSASQLPDSTLKITVTEEVARRLRDTQVIPQGNYFVLGDNREASKDSRSMGLIESDQIEGVVTYRYYPPDRIGRTN